MGTLVDITHLASLMFATPVGPRPFQPAFKLAGQSVVVGRARVAFRAPDGWSHDWSHDGSEYRIAQRFDRTAAMRRIALRNLEMPVAELLRERATDVAADLTPLGEPKIFTVAGMLAGRLIGRTVIDGVEVEGYLGAVVVGDELIEIAALYSAGSADVMRAGLDTIMATLDVG